MSASAIIKAFFGFLKEFLKLSFIGFCKWNQSDPTFLMLRSNQLWYFKIYFMTCHRPRKLRKLPWGRHRTWVWLVSSMKACNGQHKWRVILGTAVWEYPRKSWISAIFWKKVGEFFWGGVQLTTPETNQIYVRFGNAVLAILYWPCICRLWHFPS